MKNKILLGLVLSLFGIFAFIPGMVKAETILQSEPLANTGGLWHVEDGNRVYAYMRYNDGELVRETGAVTNSAYPEYNYTDYTYLESQQINDYYEFKNTDSLKTASLQNPNNLIYDKFVIEIIANITTIAGDEPQTRIIESYDTELVNDITVNLIDDNFSQYRDLSYIDILINGVKVVSTKRDYETNQEFYNDTPLGVRMYWEKDGETTVLDPEEHIETGDMWESLPVTSGNPVNPVGEWGTVNNFSQDNTTDLTKVSFNVDYLGDIFSVIDLPVDGDLSFIEKSNDILYYHDPETGDKMLYFNFGDTLQDAILMARNFSSVNEWKGEALWNLTKNEIKTTNKATVYNYIPDIDQDGNVYSYFYMPDIPIDNLISVTSVLAYRYHDNGFLGIGGDVGETQYKTVSALRGESTQVNSNWVETTYKSAYIATSLTALATVTGIIPGYGWAIAGATYLTGLALQVSDYNEWFAYDVQQIQNVIPDTTLANNINNYIQVMDGETTYNRDTDKLYKLHLATLDDNAQVVSESSKVTQIVYETNGEIFVINEDNIDNIEWTGPGTEIPDNNGLINIDDNIIWIGAVILFLFLYNSMNLSKKPGLLIIVIGGMVYVLFRIGMI